MARLKDYARWDIALSAGNQLYACSSWRSLYMLLRSNQYSSSVNVVKSFVKANGEDLKRVPPMTSGETQLILGAVESTYREDVSEVLMPYMVGSQEGPVLR